MESIIIPDDAERAARIENVHAWQLRYGMQPRSDSRLTRLFAECRTPLSAPEVARELVATDFIYKETLYGELIEEFLRCVAERLRETYRLSWTATWNIVSFYGPLALKLLCVSTSGVRIPTRP